MNLLQDVVENTAQAGGSTTRRPIHYNRSQSVPEVVRGHAAAFPDAMAIICDDARLTYGELDTLSDGLATYLLSCGVGKGDVVCLLVPRALETVVAKLAILKAGAAYLPLDPAYPADHLQYVLDECQPKVVFTAGNHNTDLKALIGSESRVVDLFSVLQSLRPGDPARLPSISGGDLAYVMYTSGSTGRPKGVAIPHRGILHLVLEQNFINIGRTDVVLHSTTISFDASTMDIWGALLNCATLLVMSQANFSISELYESITRNEVTSATMTAGLFNLLADYVDQPMPSLRQIRFGGEVASAPHVKRFAAAHPNCLLTNVYGPTEATCISTTFTVPNGFNENEIPIGSPIANTEILLVDEYHEVVPQGGAGEIAIAGNGVALGYFKRPDLTAERFVTIRGKRCYLTGDIANIDANGIFWFRGRRDRQVKINGKRIELAEIEMVLRQYPRVSDAVVECCESGGVKRLVAYLRPRDPHDLSNMSLIPAVMERLRNSLPAYMIPSTALIMAEFPLTRAGKIDRAGLPLPTINITQTTVVRSQSEEMLAGFWRDALGLDAVEVDRNFFDIGGTSLQLMRVHANLELKLGRPLEVLELFKHPTVREMARFLDGHVNTPSRSTAADQRAALQRRTMARIRRVTP